MAAMLIWGAFCAALAALCLAKPNPGRFAIGFLFLAMATFVNFNLAIRDPQRFVTFADGSSITLYRAVALRVVSPAPALFGVLVAAYEIAVALLVLGRGRAVQVGFAGVILFLLWIIPLGKEEAPNVILIAGVAPLLTRRFETALPGAIWGTFRRTGGTPAHGRPGSARAGTRGRVRSAR